MAKIHIIIKLKESRRDGGIHFAQIDAYILEVLIFISTVI